MKILGLDLSSSSGYAIIDENGLLLDKGLLTADKIQTAKSVTEEYSFILGARNIAKKVRNVILKAGTVDYVIVEQTNLGKNRSSQKYLEFIHFAVLCELEDLGLEYKTYYCDTSKWRSGLEIKLSKEQRAHNKDLSEKKKKAKEKGDIVKVGSGSGKITWKHLSVNWVNSMFSLGFKIKDNDIADAICLAYFGHLKISQFQEYELIELDLDKIFNS